MLLSVTLALLLQPMPAAACFAECPEGQECYFEEVWLSEAELQEMADAQCPGADNQIAKLSTGQAVEFHCSPEGNEARQISPNLSRKIRGEEKIGSFQKFRSDCEGQEDCLAAGRENRAIFDEMKAQQSAGNARPSSP